MLHYEDFQETIIGETGDAGQRWLHILPAVPMAFRNRFLFTIRKDFSIPESFDMVMLSQKLPDSEYELFVEQALTTRSVKDIPVRRVDKFNPED